MKRAVLIALLSAGAGFAQVTTQTAADSQKAAELKAYELSRKLGTLRSQQTQAQATYAAQSKVYTDNHPILVQQRKRMDDLEAQIQKGRSELDALRKQFPSPYSLKLAPGEGLSATYGFPTPITSSLPIKAGEAWWRNSAMIQKLELSADQRAKMDQTIQQHRLKLIDLNATLEKEEVTLEPLVAAETLDEAKITAQIDRVAQARAELEKANGRMLLSIRRVLTPEQWRMLNQSTSKLTF